MFRSEQCNFIQKTRIVGQLDIYYYSPETSQIMNF